MSGETILDTFVTRFGFKTDKTGLKEGKKGLADFKATAIKTAGAIGAILAGGFFLKHIATAADETIKWADANGIVVESLGELEFAVQRQGGTTDGLRSSLSNLNKSIGEVERGTGRAKLAFEDYGLSVKKNNGQTKTADELFSDLNKKFVTLSKAQQFDLAMKMGIDKGTILLLQTAPEQIAELRQEAAKLGVLSRRDAVKAADFMDGLTNIGQALQALKFEIGGMVFAPLSKFFKLLATGVSYIRIHKTAFSSMIAFLGLLGAAYVALQAKAAIAWLIALGPIIAIPAAIIAAAAVLGVLAEDFAAFFNDQDSFIGDLVEKWEWLGDIINGVKDFFVEAFNVAENLSPADIGNNMFSLGAPLGTPSAIGPAMNNSRSVVGGSRNVRIDKIEVNAGNGSAKEIAQNVTSEFKNQLQNTVEDVDSDIER